ncbi:peptide ABC transporter substrate-binding protein [Lentilactobacillus hilgardii]|uniref:peptide ABC transporter substrate-binding protein n=1 Tax=Lentilactobacillus hilgardii TaxID=1588 RepID=UPI0021C29F9D|nr:peptide ABC transporter substrate-binding protein [Lentilactobacillus hilgardii]MCP9332032.1 peptide ABC transporter substrate-binding protein [Lentilactobacillus hilgardii]MCP9348494.1 peptide ABC transporter substrate-binding protein [Lentilactobacillus hilgardii]MCP9351341.1 peptide ABC transporter substrate-binding protein [Lentilactobacillus hilgardii]
MKLKSVMKIGGVGVLSALVLAGCGSKSSQSGNSSQKVKWMIPAAISSMDASKITDLYSSQVLNATNEGLLKMGENKTTPGVAKSYSVSKDGKTWTFNLRKSKWNDGKPVTAKDFVFAWRRTVTPKTASEYAYNFANIKNASKINSGKMSPTKLGVQADGNYKLVVHLVKPQSYFKYLVSQGYYFPEEQAAVKKYGSAYGTSAKKNAYNGPFLLKGWTGTNDTAKLVKNKSYWNAKNVKLQQMSIQTVKDPATALNSYESGKLDFTTLNGTQVKQYKNNKDYHDYLEASTSYMEMNEKKDSIFKNKNIRRALSLAIDKNQLASKVIADGTKGAKGYVPTKMASRNGKDFASQAYVKTGVEYNLTEAKKLWAKGLKQTGKKSVSLSLLCDDIDQTVKNAQFVQSNLEKLPGLKITIQNVPFKNRLSRSQNGQFDLVLSAWIADYPDPSNFLDLFTSTNSYNNGHWKNSEYDALIKKSESTDANNEAARWNDMVQAEKILMNDQGIVPLTQEAQSTLMKSKVKGVQFFPTSPQWDWSKVSVK